MFCVECGEEGPTYEGLCARCFLKKNQLTQVPEVVDLPHCAHCREFLIEGRWRAFESTEKAVSRAVPVKTRKDARIIDLTVRAIPQDRSNYLVEMEVTVRVHDLEKTETHTTLVRVKETSCPRCSKIKGSYFESILQVRSRDRDLGQEEMNGLMDYIGQRVDSEAQESRENFISRVEERHGGFDVYLSSNSLGRALAREIATMHGAEFKESSSLVGKKEGKDVYRVTFLVRLPSYRLGDIISHESKLYMIEGISATSTRARELRSHRQCTFDNSDLEGVRVQGSEGDAMEAVVVSETEEELQLMHPVTFLTLELRKPKDFPYQMGVVRVFSHEDELYLLPE